MTAVRSSSELPTVARASERDLKRAFETALERADVTYEELEAQARSGRFESVRARLAWVVVGGLGRFAH